VEFAFGIEHEVAFLRDGSRFADWTNTSFADFQRVVAALPLFPGDYPRLHVGDAGIRHKRWYVEGIERFSEAGELVACTPKGIEIRTTPHAQIEDAVRELAESFAVLRAAAAPHGLTPVCTSFNPVRTAFTYDPPLTGYEERLRAETPDLATDPVTMLTYGPDLNLSRRGLSADEVIDLGRKLTFYSPYLVPWSFSSPFHGGGLWDGLSARTHHRTGPRAAVHVFVERPDQAVASAPMLTSLARTPPEVGRIEFKAFDTCCDFRLYAALLALLKGLVLDATLPGRATVPDASLHRRAAREGFADDHVHDGARRVLAAANAALAGDPDAALLGRLHEALAARTTPAHALRRAYERTGSVIDVLRGSGPCAPGEA